MTFKHLAGGLALLATAGLAGCGSGWLPIFSSDSSSSSSTPFTILSTDPDTSSTAGEADPSGAGDPTDPRIEIDFSKRVNETTLNSGSILIRRDGEDLVFDETVESIEVSSTMTTATLHLKEPLRLGSVYDLTLTNSVKASGGKALTEQPRMFTVRDGSLSGEELISFLAPISSVVFVPTESGIETINSLDALVVIEGLTSDDIYIVALTKLGADGAIDAPIILMRAPMDEETNQGGFAVSPDQSKVSVSWNQGQPKCTDSNMDEPFGHNYVSQFVNGAWEDENNPQQIDDPVQSTSSNYISFPHQLASSDDGTTVAVWYGWTDFDTMDKTFDTWAIYSAVRQEGGPWEDPVQISPPDTPTNVQHFGWPLLARDPGADRIYALWGEADVSDGIYDEDDLHTISAYWLAVYDSGVWLPATTLVENTALPRPASFVVTEDGQGVILGRSKLNGPLAYIVDDLRQAAPTFSGPSKQDPSDSTKLFEDGVTAKTCDSFNGVRTYSKSPFPPKAIVLPAATTSGPRVLASWFEGDGTSGVELWVSEFDVESEQWIDATHRMIGDPIFADPTGNELRVSAGARVDAAGNIVLSWNVTDRFLAQGQPVAVLRGEVYAARRLAESVDWTNLDGAPNGIVSNVLFCADSGGLSNVHPSGQLILSWREPDCPSNTTFASFIRRFE